MHIESAARPGLVNAPPDQFLVPYKVGNIEDVREHLAEFQRTQGVVQFSDRRGKKARVGDLDLLPLVDRRKLPANFARLLEAGERRSDLLGKLADEKVVNAE